MNLRVVQLIKYYKALIKDLTSDMKNCKTTDAKVLIHSRIDEIVSLIKDYEKCL